MVSRCVVLVFAILVVVVAPSSAAPVVFKDVKTAFTKSATDRELVEKDAELVLDDQARTLVVKSDGHPLSVKYDDIQKIVLDTSTRMRGGKFGMMMGGAVGGAISAHHVTQSWCYLAYRGQDGASASYMLLLSTESAPTTSDKLKALFGDKVVVAQYPEATKIEKETLKDLESKHDLNIDKKTHPMPEAMADKALVVVVCPQVPQGGTTQMKIHVGDKVELVNRSGTYGFFYLEPGDYQIASQAGNAVALQMKLEAGKEYYLLQEPFMGSTKSGTGLSQHSGELVMFLLDASNHADWTRK
jgi:hypothetical protein